jgi:hypothetical protein
VVEASSGRMFHHGKERSFASPYEALVAGIAMVFQETSLVPSMTVAQNLYLGSESWRHRLIHIEPGGRREIVLDKLPGYPARMAPASNGGVWLSIFAPRNRLVEFMLQEKHYRRDMMAEVPREYWIAPALASRRSFLEPLQCGGIKTMGVHKPWAPSRSCGMVVRLDDTMAPLFSLHIRANGVRHGTCSAIEHDGRLIVAAKGGDCLLSLDASAHGGR